MYSFNIGNCQLTAAEFGLTLVLDQSQDQSLVLSLVLDQIFVMRSNSVLTLALDQTLVLDFSLRLKS